MKKILVLAGNTILVLIGLALVLPGAVIWQALQIQAGLGNTAPLQAEVVKMAFGMVCLAISWFWLKATRTL